MKEYVKRMLDEEKELRTKCQKFENFVSNSDNIKALSEEEQKLMWQQLGFMEAYYKVLARRLELLKVPLLK
jgi:DNA-binding transcriptional regulator GbsR (MarR family)